MEDRLEYTRELFLSFTYQVAAFSNDAGLVQRAFEYHAQLAGHSPTTAPGGCEECRADGSHIEVTKPVDIKRRADLVSGWWYMRLGETPEQHAARIQADPRFKTLGEDL
jgi:hypothetical protein